MNKIVIPPGEANPGVIVALPVIDPELPVAKYDVQVNGPGGSFPYSYPLQPGDGPREVVVGLIQAFQDNPSPDVTFDLNSDLLVKAVGLSIAEVQQGLGFGVTSSDDLPLISNQVIFTEWSTSALKAGTTYLGKKYEADIDPSITDPFLAIQSITQIVSAQVLADEAAAQAEAKKPDLTKFLGQNITTGKPVP